MTPLTRVLFATALLVATAHALLVESRIPLKKKKDEQDLSKVPGTPGVDYPLFKSVPPTNFHCGNVPYAPGMYANVETGCQAYHVCNDGRDGHQGASFLCPNGTLFNQHEFTCDWWYNVNCGEATKLYDLNLDPNKNPYFPKKKTPEQETPAYYGLDEPAHYPQAAPAHYAQPAPAHYAQPAHYAAQPAQSHYYDY